MKEYKSFKISICKHRLNSRDQLDIYKLFIHIYMYKLEGVLDCLLTAFLECMYSLL